MERDDNTMSQLSAESDPLSLATMLAESDRVFAELERLVREEPERAVAAFTKLAQSDDISQRMHAAVGIGLLTLADREAGIRLWHEHVADVSDVRDCALDALNGLLDEEREPDDRPGIYVTPQEAAELARTYYEAEIAEAGIPAGESDFRWRLKPFPPDLDEADG